MRDLAERRRRMVERNCGRAGIRDPRGCSRRWRPFLATGSSLTESRARIRRLPDRHRARPDDLAALHRRLHVARRCSSARRQGAGDRQPARAIRRRCSRASSGRCNSIEIVREHARRAVTVCSPTGHDNVHVRSGDGHRRLARACAVRRDHRHRRARSVPLPLVDQFGDRRTTRRSCRTWRSGSAGPDPTADGLHEESRIAVRFVPFTQESRSS